MSPGPPKKRKRPYIRLANYLDDENIDFCQHYVCVVSSDFVVSFTSLKGLYRSANLINDVITFDWCMLVLRLLLHFRPLRSRFILNLRSPLYATCKRSSLNKINIVLIFNFCKMGEKILHGNYFVWYLDPSWLGV